MKICPQCSKEFGDQFNFCPEDGTPLAKIVRQLDPLIGKLVKNKYEIIEMIREDNLGRTFKARQQPLGRVVLLEIFNQNLTREPDFHEMLNEAVRKYSKLQHVNIGTIFDMDETEDNRYFITSEFVEGQSLQTLLKIDAPLEQERCLNLCYQLVDALHQAHSNLIEHGYLTPQDIIVYSNPGGKECLQILNFGISKMLLNEKIRHYTGAQNADFLTVYDVAYISPDQASGAIPVDDLDDIYSFGVILYHALSGELPFQAETAEAMIEAHRTLEIVPLRNFTQCRSLHPHWDVICDKCLQKKKTERYQSIREVKSLLHKIGDYLKHEAEPTIMRMKSDLVQELAPAAAPAPSPEEPLETTEVVPSPPAPKKKSPPLAKTLMIDRRELMANGLGAELVFEPSTPPASAPAAEPAPAPAAGTGSRPILQEALDIRLEELGGLAPGADSPEPAGFPPSALEDTETMYINDLQPESFEADLGETLFIGDQPKTGSPAPPPASIKPDPDEPTLAGLIHTAKPDSSSVPEMLFDKTTVVPANLPAAEALDFSEETLPPLPAPPVFTPASSSTTPAPVLPKLSTVPPPLPGELKFEEIRLQGQPPARTVVERPAPATPAPAGYPPAEPGSRRSKAILILAASFILLAIIVAGAFLIFSILSPKYGGFDIRSYPEEAKVYLDGNLIGSTPLREEKIDAGPHRVKLAKEGYLPVEKDIRIEPDRILRIETIPLSKIGNEQTGPVAGPTPEQLIRLDELKSKTEEAITQKKYTDPAEDCAVYYINQILEIDPASTYALETRQRVIDFIKERAEKAAAGKNWFLANKLYGQLTGLAPGDESLQNAAKEVETQLNLYLQKKNEAIKDLTKKAEKALAEGRLVMPAEENAYELCQQIKQLDGSNRFAASKMQWIRNQVPLSVDEAILSENWQQAKALIEAFNRYFPGDSGMARKLERIEQKMSETSRAQEQQERERQRQLNLSRATDTLNNGIAEYKKGNYANALTQLEGALAINPQLTDAYFYLGASYLEMKNYAKAQEFFKKAIQVNPNHAMAHLNLGILAQTDRNYELALEHLQKVVQLGGVPNYPVDRLQTIIKDVETRLKYKSLLNRSVAVRHKHFIGDCTGYLVFTADNIRYETNENKHAFNLPLRALRGLAFEKGEEMSFQAEDQKYKFSLKNNADYQLISTVVPEYLKLLK